MAAPTSTTTASAPPPTRSTPAALSGPSSASSPSQPLVARPRPAPRPPASRDDLIQSLHGLRTLVWGIPGIIRQGDAAAIRAHHESIVTLLDLVGAAAAVAPAGGSGRGTAPAPRVKEQATANGHGGSAVASDGATDHAVGAQQPAPPAVTVVAVNDKQMEIAIPALAAVATVTFAQSPTSGPSAARRIASVTLHTTSSTSSAPAAPPVLRRLAHLAETALRTHSDVCAVAWATSAARTFLDPCTACGLLLKPEADAGAAPYAAPLVRWRAAAGQIALHESCCLAAYGADWAAGESMAAGL
ncbi:hypothetical protein AMAG_02417 [Allomyces macrogynus ATCC 38327]|uniref:Uncharacterized protein n=1 Tax=Allomyces macrogynus (strain ATCC 38327) TaxID=578462 RepID=A0A0L0S2P0_ALLM3|nr:hypothetical protein AMAG_02417 [Allomyces macrogynus ATCC 38327]|eukprot:KNE56629.1 hypothetical protein AMAG_02417 [Allomyces macrogynus ATCC 38327]